MVGTALILVGHPQVEREVPFLIAWSSRGRGAMTTTALEPNCAPRLRAAHCAGMNTPISRQPQGIPAGGQFAAATHPESADVLLDVADRPLALAPGESEDFTEYADGDVITRLSVLRSDDGGTFHIEASAFVNFKDMIPASDLGTDEEGRDAWLDSNSSVIESFIRDRYDAEADTTDWNDVRVECGASIQADSVTGKQITDEAWNRSGIVALHNESDPGTFGSENLGRLVREHVEAQAIPADINAARSAAVRMTAADIDNLVTETRNAGRNISDAGAIAIARTFSQDSAPEVRSLGRLGFGNREVLKTELLTAYENAAANTDRARIEMMLAWLVDGGDNS